jgi:hypothetical protein
MRSTAEEFHNKAQHTHNPRQQRLFAPRSLSVPYQIPNVRPGIEYRFVTQMKRVDAYVTRIDLHGDQECLRRPSLSVGLMYPLMRTWNSLAEFRLHDNNRAAVIMANDIIRWQLFFYLRMP